MKCPTALLVCLLTAAALQAQMPPIPSSVQVVDIPSPKVMQPPLTQFSNPVVLPTHIAPPQVAEQKIVLPPPVAATKSFTTSSMGKVNANQGASGFKLKDVSVNDLFQYLARQAGKQYFANSDLTQTITGQMKEGDPIERMQEVAFQYGITLFQKGETIYAIPSDAVATLPKKQAEFVLRYLRPDRARLQELITPFLTPGSGSVDFEDKTDTVVINDNDPAIARVADFLQQVDRPQRQITIQVRVFRVNTDAENHVGIDWSQSLGAQGTSLQAVASSTLSSVFGVGIAKQVLGSMANSSFAPSAGNLFSLSSTNKDFSSSGGTNSLALGPTTVTAVLRALYQSQNVEEENNPTVVTEDNEEAIIENLDKIPIVTSTTDTSSAGATTASTVRYRIDPDDPFDVGVKLKVRPTILPGNKIRLIVEPSVGSITGYVNAASGNPALPNRYPDVILSRMKNIATIPNGYTLLFGGFSRVTTTKDGNKVPILGDIPIVNFFFKSRANTKIRENLVFMITATATDLGSPEIATAETERLRRTYITTKDDHSAEEDRVRLTPEPNLIGTIQDELTPFSKKLPTANPISPRNKENQNLSSIQTPQQKEQGATARKLGLAPGAPDTMPSPAPTPAQTHRKLRPWEHIIPPRSTGE